MAINKVVYGGDVLLDLTGDTVSADTLVKGITAHDASGETIVGTNTYDSDTSDATANVAEVLLTKTYYARGTKATGTMPNNGSVQSQIAQWDEIYIVPQGYHDGSGRVEIAETERAKLTPANIRQGITVLGVEGEMTGTEDVTAETVTVTPSKNGTTVTPSGGYNYLASVIVQKIPYVEMENAAGGVTVTIAG